MFQGTRKKLPFKSEIITAIDKLSNHNSKRHKHSCNPSQTRKARLQLMN